MVVLDFNKFFLDRSDHLNDLAIRGFIVHFWLGSGSPRFLPIVCDDIQCLLVNPARETFFIGPGNWYRILAILENQVYGLGLSLWFRSPHRWPKHRLFRDDFWLHLLRRSSVGQREDCSRFLTAPTEWPGYLRFLWRKSGSTGFLMNLLDYILLTFIYLIEYIC